EHRETAIERERCLERERRRRRRRDGYLARRERECILAAVSRGQVIRAANRRVANSIDVYRSAWARRCAGLARRKFVAGRKEEGLAWSIRLVFPNRKPVTREGERLTSKREPSEAHGDASRRERDGIRIQLNGTASKHQKCEYGNGSSHNA